VAVPGERLNRAVVDHLRTGVEMGMVVPDGGPTLLEEDSGRYEHYRRYA
jgi:hypothetical protein